MDDWRVWVGVAVMTLVVVLFLQALERAAEREYADRKDARANGTARAVAAYATVNRPQWPALQTLTYGPHQQYQLTGAAPAPAALPDPVGAESAAPALRVPPMRELLANGTIRPGGPLVLGVRVPTGDPLLGTQESLFTTADAGKSSSGKTRTAAFILGQAVLQGTRLLVIDPHMHKADSLSNLLRPLERATVPGPDGRRVPVFVRPIAGTQAEALKTVALGEQIMAERRNGGPCWPLLLVVDEFTLIIRQGEQLGPRAAALIESVATEGRGFGFNGLILGQNWKGTRAGGTEVREVLTSAYVHRSVKRQAAYLIQDDDLAAQAETLTKGWAIFAPTDDDPQLIGIPLAEAADMATVAQLLTVLAPSPAPSQVVDAASWAAAPATDGEGAREGAEKGGEALSERAQLVRELVRAGTPSSQIIQQVWGVSGGKGYQAAAQELTGILAQLVP